MQGNVKCKEHGEFINAICTTCGGLMCFKCLTPHAKKGCKFPIDIFTHTKEDIMPKFKSQLDDFEKQKSTIEASIKLFVTTSEHIRSNLIELKRHISLLLESIETCADSLKVDINKLLYCNDIKQFLTDEYNGLLNAIEKEDAEYIIKRFNYIRAVNMFELGQVEKKLINTINASISTLQKTEDIKTLTQSLKQLASIYGTTYAPKVIKDYVYGICAPQYTYNKLCKYNISSKKLTTCIEVPSHSTITQFDSHVFISGGSKPLISSLSEYIEDTQSLVLKQPMNCPKYAHKTVATSTAAFITIGGTTGNTPIAYCEEYSLREDKWRMIPLLNKARCNAPGVLLDRYLYVIGGTGTNGEIELLNVNEMKEWVMVEVKVNELRFDDSPEAFPISREEIMILKGGNTGDTAIYNTKDKSIKQWGSHLKKDWYYYNTTCIIANIAYIIGSRGHIHIFNITDKKFQEVDYSLAYS